ncbi:MAG: hypothetical protein C1943_19520 [Halochromatium sp.]|nr:hypothetical protein [Halochromatium sp.]
MTGAGGSLPATFIQRTQHPVNEDLSFLVLRQLQANPKQTQLQRSQAIGISVGRTNYIVRALIVENRTRPLFTRFRWIRCLALGRAATLEP